MEKGSKGRHVVSLFYGMEWNGMEHSMTLFSGME